MTVADLIERLQALPGSTDIRPVIAIKFLRRNGDKDEEEYRVDSVELSHVSVRLILGRER